MMKYIAILFLAGTACLWLFGRGQPVVVAGSTVTKDKQTICRACGGSGTMETSVTCPKCKGTGRGEWFFKSRAKRDSFEGSKPMCLHCKGKGKALQQAQCRQCKGTGKTTSAEPQTVKSVRADLSLWEKVILWMRFKPDQNCGPQRKTDGSYPLVAKYIEIMLNPGYDINVVEWFPARLEEGKWIVGTRIEFKGKSGLWVEQDRDFIIENREVKGTRKTERN